MTEDKKKDEDVLVLEIIHTMTDIHSIEKSNEEIDLASLSVIYQDFIDACPKSESHILRTLKNDLLRLTEYKNQLPDLLSSITWVNIFSEYEKRGQNEQD